MQYESSYVWLRCLCNTSLNGFPLSIHRVKKSQFMDVSNILIGSFLCFSSMRYHLTSMAPCSMDLTRHGQTVCDCTRTGYWLQPMIQILWRDTTQHIMKSNYQWLTLRHPEIMYSNLSKDSLVSTIKLNDYIRPSDNFPVLGYYNLDLCC